MTTKTARGRGDVPPHPLIRRTPLKVITKKVSTVASSLNQYVFLIHVCKKYHTMHLVQSTETSIAAPYVRVMEPARFST
jgi:hypothetical protein